MKLKVNEEQTAGCCIDDIENSVDLRVDFIGSFRSGPLTIFLDTPDMQSQQLGVIPTGQSPFKFSGNIFPGAVAKGVWKLNFGGTAWTATVLECQLQVFVEQCA